MILIPNQSLKGTKYNKIVKMTRKKKGFSSFPKHSTKFFLVSNSPNEDSSS
jgi:hypothetical protein